MPNWVVERFGVRVFVVCVELLHIITQGSKHYEISTFLRHLIILPAPHIRTDIILQTEEEIVFQVSFPPLSINLAEHAFLQEVICDLEEGFAGSDGFAEHFFPLFPELFDVVEEVVGGEVAAEEEKLEGGLVPFLEALYLHLGGYLE